MQNDYDVVIIGGGPAGSTCGTLLKKYDPSLSVLILERESFPREHVGESQLPPINSVLQEMGVWDDVERAGFPIKIGATYRWGTTDELWDFEFYPTAYFRDEPRPAKYVGQRTRTAFQVDRARYDEILLDHAAKVGCDVRQSTKVAQVEKEGDVIRGVVTDAGDRFTGKSYVDCSGASGLLRRVFDIGITEPSALRNVALWDYWTDAEWAVSVGKGATRVQVMSLGYGWIWFIPIAPDRTSIGLVVPAEYYRQSGKRPRELYDAALQEEPLISSLIKKARPEGELRSTRDWSFVANRMVGENWLLAGESAGFADPILAAGMTLAHVGAREAAYTILARKEGKQDRAWLDEQYTKNQTTRILQHIRFADFWYTANGRFTDLKAYTSEIAKDAGLKLAPDEAFQWLGTGGFVSESFGTGLAGHSLGALQDIVDVMLDGKADLMVARYNRLYLDVEGADRESFALYADGRISTAERFVRDGKTLPIFNIYHLMILILMGGSEIRYVIDRMVAELLKAKRAPNRDAALELGISFLESMIRDRWVRGETVPGEPLLNYKLPRLATNIHFNRDIKVPSG